jgi:hypothetical protein
MVTHIELHRTVKVQAFLRHLKSTREGVGAGLFANDRLQRPSFLSTE